MRGGSRGQFQPVFAMRPLLRCALAACLTLLAALPAFAAEPLGALEAPLWLRYPAISPDGRQVAFSFQGGLYLVGVEGGTARLLVANGRRSHAPVWSPDGRTIAFASDVYGNDDVFVVAASGGPARRLTTHSAPEQPTGFTPDGRAVLFAAQRLDDRRNLLFPSRWAGELYRVSVEGGRRPQQLLSTPALAARFDRAGTRLLYEDWKGYESPWRKHHVSPVARDVWLFDAASGRHRKLTEFGGEDRDPVWSPDEQAFYYLSERSGSFNVWRQGLEGGAPQQLTFFERHPVRFLSISAQGVLAFGWDGELYTLPAGAGQPRRLAVQIGSDTRGRGTEPLKLSEGASEITVSPDGKEIAFVVRGEVFVASTEFGDTRRITDTPTQERSVQFSPDGRRLAFAGERDGAWNLYEATIVGQREDAPHFFAARELAVRTLLANGQENFQPRWSPDGKEIAFLENRTTLKVLNLAGGKARTVLPGEHNYSYVDGDQWFDWSPDGRWLLSQMVDRQRWSNEVALVDASGQRPPRNLTRSGYEDLHPQWARGGRQLLWTSDRMGLHATGGIAQTDVFAMYLTREAWDRFRLDKAEYALLKEKESAAQKGKGEEAKKDAPAEPRLADPVPLELDGAEQRVARLTPNSGWIRALAMTPDGETLLFLHQAAEDMELWLHRPREKELRRLASLPSERPPFWEAPPADLQLDAQGETGYLLVAGNLHRFKLPQGDAPAKLEPVKFSAELNLDRAAERAYLFEHVWRQTLKKLYVADMGGVDWDFYKRAYARFLPFIGNDEDFAECLSEMLGELNVSHTGAGVIRRGPDDDATAALGAFFDERHAGAGLKIAEPIAGGPLETAGSAARAGSVIERIDGEAITPGREVDSLLNRKAGKRVVLSLLDPASGKRSEQVVKAISLKEEETLLYRRWVRLQRETVERLSGGRVGYVHVRDMDDDSYRDTYAEVLGRHSDKQALVVDTRFNGGGWLHDDLALLLSGRRYLEILPRGQRLGWEPTVRWNRPSIVLISEGNYSDAHLFPWVYRHLGLGKLVGMPVAGTGTAVWWETLQNDSIYFGIPQVGYRDEKGEYMESALVAPDLVVPIDPAEIAAGRDEQLEAAVRELLK